MRFLSRRAGLVIVGGAFVVGIPLSAQAVETSNSEFVIIQEDDIVSDDLYAGAIRVVVEGTLDGDLIAFAAEEVMISGTVTGSVTAITPRLTIDGTVEEDVRFTGQNIAISGEVGGDVVAVAWSAVLAAESTVEGTVLAWAWNLDALGTVGEDLSGSQRNLNLAGDISGDVDVSVTQLSVTGPLNVEGDLGYRSDREAEGLEQAQVAGAVVAKQPLPPNLRVRALTLLGRFMVVLFLGIAALTTAYGWPSRTSKAIGSVQTKPVRNWLTGATFIFAPILMLGVTAVIVGLAPPAASFPLLVVLIPIILALTGFSLALCLVAGVPVAGFVGGVAFRRLDLFGAILAGSLLLGLAWLLPWVGWLIPIVALPLGLGAWLRGFAQTTLPSV